MHAQPINGILQLHPSRRAIARVSKYRYKKKAPHGTPRLHVASTKGGRRRAVYLYLDQESRTAARTCAKELTPAIDTAIKRRSSTFNASVLDLGISIDQSYRQRARILAYMHTYAYVYIRAYNGTCMRVVVVSVVDIPPPFYPLRV